MTTKQWGLVALGVVLALAAAYTAGSRANPAKIIEKEKIVEVKKEVKVVDQEAISFAVSQAQAEWKKNEKVRTITKILYKEGQIVEKIIYKDRETSDSGSSSSSGSSGSSSSSSSTTTNESTTTTTKTKETEFKQPTWRLSLSASTKWNSLPKTAADLTYEGRVERQLIGGFWGGITTTPQLKLVGITLSFQN